MRWRRNRWPERIPRPKARRLTEKEKSTILAAMTRAVVASPVLSYLGVQVRALRGRFYLERELKEEGKPATEILGRITPLAAAKGTLLLEVERRSGSWHEVAEGSAQKLIKVVASDTKGKFHGLGSVDKVLRKAKKGLHRLPVRRVGKYKFVYSDTGAVCTAQDALFHYFRLPLDVIAEPSAWYSYHRVPQIVETSRDRTRVLVWFSAASMTGSFGGTCLYAQRDGSWGAYPIKPSESGSILTAEAWLVKRRWKAWC
ncbi:MAG TPA: hypothetical protein VMV69_09920 [Pirellulales bacterium]|nr:hypothetical protein [Pirellulales bacterium]